MAEILTTYLNSMRTKDNPTTFTVEDILAAKYSVVTTPLPKSDIPWDVMGVQGNWQGLRNKMTDYSNRPTGRKH